MRPVPLVTWLLVLWLAWPAGAVTVFKTVKAGRDGAYTVEMTYPRFTDATPVARLATRTLDAWVSADVAHFVKTARQTLALRPQPPGPYAYEGAGTVSYAAPARTISVLLDVYKFAGGAHGGAWYVPFNFAVVAGAPKRLLLGDLFRPGTAYTRLVSHAVIAKLMAHEGAMWVRDGQVTSLTAEQLNRFSITPAGLTFLINQYEAGPYVSGRFEVKLTINELGAGFDRRLVYGP